MSDNEKRNDEFEEDRLQKADLELQEINGTGDNPLINEPLLPGILHKALINNNKKEILEMANENSPILLAEVLNLLTDNEVTLFFSMVNDYSVLGSIFSYLSVEERIVLCKNLNKKVLTSVLVYVKDDDLADFLDDVNKQLRESIISILPQKRRKIIANLASYSDDTIGSIMTTEYLSVRPETIVKDIFKKIKEIGNKLETVRTIFITDSNNKLVGTMSLEKMMFEDEESKIEEIMNKDFAYISPNADKEEAIPICRNYDLAVLPVMSKTGELLGIITFDDVMDVIEEANTEDVLKQAGVTPSGKPYAQTKAFRMALSYVMWLIILLVINTFTSIIISNFEHALLTLPVLISFLPALNDTGGNSGDQTTSIITRSLATGEITVKDYFKVAGKELLVGFLTALIIAAFNFGWVMVELNAHLVKIDDIGSMSAALGNITTQQSYMVIAGLVSVALFFSVVVSKFLGASLPMLAKLCHIDPAIMSGPLIASIMDILTLLIYFTVSITVINFFSGLAASVTLLI